MMKLFKTEWISTLLLVSILIFLIFDTISVPLISYYRSKGCMAAIGYCRCSCYHPNAFDCACDYDEDNWYYYCYSLCVCWDETTCCEDPPPWDPDYPIRKCPKTK